MSSVPVINVKNQTCTCRWFLAYSIYLNLYKSFEIFDIKKSFAKFGPKKSSKVIEELDDALAPGSHMTVSQLSNFNSLDQSYNRINYFVWPYESIYLSPVKITEIIKSQIKEEPSKVELKN
jgi:hypothetical protein